MATAKKAKTPKKTTARSQSKASTSKKTALWSQPKTRVPKKKVVQKKDLRAFAASNWIALWVLIALLVPQIALLWRPVVGAYVTAAALAALLGLAVRFESARRLAVAASILPVTLLVSLSLPQPDAFAQAGVFYSTILLLVIMFNYSFSLHEPIDFSVFTKRNWLFIPCMVVLGEVLGGLGYGAMHSNSAYIFHGVPTGLVAIGAVIFAVAEELLFRGLIQERAAKVVHPIVAAVLATLAYSVVYISHGSLMPAIFAVVSGAVLSGVYYFKQNLVLTTILNTVMKLSYLGLMATYVLH